MGFSFYSIWETNSPREVLYSPNDADLILKFPLGIPYLSDWQSPEPSDDEILKGNEYYKIVSKQILNGTLYVRCEFSQTSRERFWSLVSSFDDHSKTNSDSHKGSASTILKSFLKEYMALGRKHTFYFFEWPVPAAYYYVSNTMPLPFISLQSPPPDQE